MHLLNVKKMLDEKIVDVLNRLITLNNDRIEGYQTASKETLEKDLKTIFSQFAKTSEQCKAELEHEVYKLGGTPDEGTRITGKFFRMWMRVKAALTYNNLKVILDSCEVGEDMVGDIYKQTLSENVGILTMEQKRMISAQYVALKANHQKIKGLRDAVAWEQAV
jgi:uncharacterized protein (TIGR02284 family)